MSELTVKAEEFGIEESKANELTKGLSVPVKERELLIQEFDSVASLEMTKENLPKFRELRLRIQKNRTQGINKWHKSAKAYFLAGGKFVDAIKSKESLVNEQMEEKLMGAEKHFENLEIARIKQLQEDRSKEIAPYVEDAHLMDLGSMDLDVWEAYFSVKKDAYIKAEAEAKRIEAERLAKEKADRIEAEKLAEEERKRVAKVEAENKRLKKEQEKKDRLAKIESDRVLAEKKAAEEKAAKLQEAKEKAEKEAEQTRIKAEKERQRLAQIEIDRIAQIEADKEAELKKGDAEKKADLINDLIALKTKYVFKSKENKKLYESVGGLIDKVTKYIESK